MIKDVVTPEIRRELLQRGFSRRTFGRFAALMSAGATLPFYNEAALAQGLSAVRGLPPDAVRINANENPLGPCPEAAEAIYGVVKKGGRPRASDGTHSHRSENAGPNTTSWSINKGYRSRVRSDPPPILRTGG